MREFDVNIIGLSKKAHLFDFKLKDGFFEKYGKEVVSGGDFDVHVVLDKKETKDFWNKNSYLPTKTAGYDEYFIVDVKAATKNLVEELNVNSKMTRRTMAKEFIKHSGKKASNRVMLSRFIERIVNKKKIAA